MKCRLIFDIHLCKCISNISESRSIYSQDHWNNLKKFSCSTIREILCWERYNFRNVKSCYDNKKSYCFDRSKQKWNKSHKKKIMKRKLASDGKLIRKTVNFCVWYITCTYYLLRNWIRLDQWCGQPETLKSLWSKSLVNLRNRAINISFFNLIKRY